MTSLPLLIYILFAILLFKIFHNTEFKDLNAILRNHATKMKTCHYSSHEAVEKVSLLLLSLPIRSISGSLFLKQFSLIIMWSY